MNTFTTQRANRLLLSALPSTYAEGGRPSERTQALHSALVALNPPLATGSKAVETALYALKTNHRTTDLVGLAQDDEAAALENAVLGRVAVALYADAMDTFLAEASDAENEAEWWADIERSRWSTAWYLIQTLPNRLRNALHEIMVKLRDLDIPIQPSSFTPSSLRQLFPSPEAFRPGPLATALFPHLRSNPHVFSLTGMHPGHLHTHKGGLDSVRAHASYWSSALVKVFTLPLDLARQECGLKRKALQAIRDERAEALGRVADLQPLLESAIISEANQRVLQNFLLSLQSIASDNQGVAQSSILGSLNMLATSTLPSHKQAHEAHLQTQSLKRPSRLTLLWPRLVLLPPLTLYLIQYAYNSRDALAITADAALETVDRFWHDWLLDPLKGVVQTIRAGDDERVIVSSKGLSADIESLDRMSVALASEKLNFTAEQLAELSSSIRLGDLTPVQRIYEEDIKTPLRSALTGTLLRSVFIQVQKAKVDIDQTLSGIDKLLKSQELTFAFVGVAPAFALVYVVGGVLKRALFGGSRRVRYGGHKSRASSWVTMRRIERLLISTPRGSADTVEGTSIPPLTSGLLLLSVGHLRQYAERYFPIGSRLREGFLEDVSDLENPQLGRQDKIRVVDRMWRSWSSVLGWERVPDR